MMLGRLFSFNSALLFIGFAVCMAGANGWGIPVRTRFVAGCYIVAAVIVVITELLLVIGGGG